jgi:hypothetical protein
MQQAKGQEIVLMETHENIEVNPPFVKSDFAR